ncbi:Slit-like 2 protein [Holothuria leucospilota]|uniref:Slit-like 2 protein n=1 Tax=Holothuria leucospilota TaxID=206669 RepID=A0A9Q1BKN6_HOLLE|nr:Slit-like 2 protein [Holothuria leucospilota]
MLSVWVILLTSVAVECQECQPCPDMCTCGRWMGLDCSGLGLPSIEPGLCESGGTEDVNFSDNNITMINWKNIPLLEGSYCDIILRNNSINESRGVFILKECNSFDLDLSYNSLTTLPTDFFVAYSDSTFVDIILTHNLITDIMPGAIKIYNNSDIFLDLYLSFNKISYIHPGAFEVDVDLFDLELQNNNLVSFSVLSALRSVTSTPVLFYLDLRNNLIEDLQVEDEDGFSYRGINVKLDNNPWNCDCKHKSIAFEDSILRTILKRSPCYQPTCSTPDIVRNIGVLFLSPKDFICPPRLDSIIGVTDIEISPGENANLVCPVTFADPPITHYDWTFSPKLPATDPKVFGTELWEVRFIRKTISNHVKVENVQLEGDFECHAVSPNGTLSVNISVSFHKTQTTLPSDSLNAAHFVTSFSIESPFRNIATTTATATATATSIVAKGPTPGFSNIVLSIMFCVASVLFLVTFLALCIVSIKYFKLRRSQQVSGRDTDNITTNPKQKSLHHTYKIVYKVSNNVTVDDEDYCVPSKTLFNKATGSNEGYANFNKHQKRNPRICNKSYFNEL